MVGDKSISSPGKPALRRSGPA